MSVFVTTTNVISGAEELYDDRTFLIKGPVEDGKTTYFLTRALERYAVPDVNPNNEQTVEEYFNKQLVSSVYLAIEVHESAQVRTNFSNTGLSKL